MLTRDIREGDEVITPSGRVALVRKVVDEGDFLMLRYVDDGPVTGKDEADAELTLSVRYCRLLQGWNGRPRGRPPKSVNREK